MLQYLQYLLVVLRGVKPAISYYVLYELLVVLWNTKGLNYEVINVRVNKKLQADAT